MFDILLRILRQAGIDGEFAAGDLAAPEASLITAPSTPRQGREREAACRARRDIALEIVATTAYVRKGTLMGMAVPLAKEGLNARVFDDHVRDTASRQNCEYTTVLAHAMAHEIGHVLLRNGAHTQRGLMPTVWTDFEYWWMARGLMLFTGDQAKAMRASLSGAGCSPPTLAEVLH